MLSVIFIVLFSSAALPADLAAAGGLSAEMHARFAGAMKIQRAVIDGDLDKAQALARELAAMAPGDRPYADLRTRFGSLAELVSSAGSIPEAATGTARILGACGACHELHGAAAYHFESSVPVPTDDDRPMAQHGWAVDRLAEALVGRVDQSWAAGAEALVVAPLAIPAEEQSARRRVEAMADCVQGLGREALDTARWQARERLYGRLLASCASCHRAFRSREETDQLVTCGMQSWY